MHVLTLRVGDSPEIRLPVRDGETLDAAITRCGFTRPRRGCRRGGCGQCMITVLAGSVVDERPVATTVLTPADRDGGRALACRSVPVTDVVVGADRGQIRCVSPLQADLARRELERAAGVPTRPTSTNTIKINTNANTTGDRP